MSNPKIQQTKVTLNQVEEKISHVPVVNFIYLFLKRNMGVLIGFLLLSLALVFSTDKFLTIDNTVNILRQVSINAILAIGITCTLLTIGVDLSIGSTVAMSGVMAVTMISTGFPVAIACLAALAAGALAGLFNGFIISRTGMPAFIVTLATQNVIRGFAYVATGGQPITSSNETFNYIGNGYVGPVPVPIIIMVVVAIVASIMLTKTKFGRHMYATGGNKEAAIYSGLHVKNIQMSVYIISGLLAALAGIMLAARMYSGQPTTGVGYEGDAVAAAVLGGTSFTGGVGTIGGTMIGALVIGVLNNGMNLLKIPYYYQLVVKGLVILGAVYVDTVKKRQKV